MDLQQLIALQKASGGQNVITPDNAGRIMGLAAQQEANRQLSVGAGKLAVQEALNRQIASGERAAPNEQGEMDQYGRYVSPLQRQGRVVTAPSGAKFVTDAQGNVVGTNASIGVGAGGIGDRAAINRGEATTQERMLIGPAIREAFQLEMQKRGPTQAVPVPEEAPPTAPTPPVVPPPANPPPNAAEIQKLQAEQRGLENMFGVNALPSQEQRGEDASRADLYRELQKVSRELSAGVQDIPGLIGPPGAINPQRTLTPEDLSVRQKRKAELEGKIKESGARSSKMAAAKAAPKDAMARYQAILDSLARASK